MLKIHGVMDKEYPRELVSQCRRSTNQIVRNSKNPHLLYAAGTTNAAGLSDSADVSLTLLEVAQPEPYQFYDIFEVQNFTFSKEQRQGNFKAEISLLESYRYLEIYANILDLNNETVLAEIPVKKAENTNTLILEQDFMLTEAPEDNLTENMAVIAYGKWGNSSPEENELAVEKEVNTQYPGVKYTHTYPKKEEEAVQLGTLEENFKPAGGVGDPDHIVIALIRRPEDTGEVDYLCGAGRDKSLGNHPILCVPGEGTIYFPSGETPMTDADHQNQANCKLYKKSGGASVIASTDNPEYSTNAIKITSSNINNSYTYQFMSWFQGYKESGGWEKKKFEYRLELTLNTTRADGTWVTREFFIDSRNPEASLTKQVLTLEIMYGCMAPETEISMDDGSKRQIRHIRIGDTVTGMDGAAMQVQNIWRGPELDNMVEIRAEGLAQTLFLTKSHPVKIQQEDGTEKWKRAGVCIPGDKVLVQEENGQEVWRPISEMIEREPCEEVYNLDLQPVHDSEIQAGTMYCNGILTGDNRMQNSDLEG